jgi:antitoxin component YwqK of YwqJK toxin-antitoxin module
VRKYLPFIIVLIGINNCLGQETVKHKNRLTPSVIEVYQVLKSDNTIKQGLYKALYLRNTPLAIGEYTNNKRSGLWHFYDTHGRLVENFNYDRETITYEEPIDSITTTTIVYAFDRKFTDSDRVTKPIKPGGRCYGYIPYLNVFKLPDSFGDANLVFYTGILELLISPGGRLADFKVHIKSRDDDYVTSFSPDIIDAQDRIFVPATVNNEPILSRIFVRCRITFNGELDVN